MVSISRAARQVMRQPDDMMRPKQMRFVFFASPDIFIFVLFHPAKNRQP